MRKILVSLITGSILLVTCHPQKPGVLTIATSANMQYAIRELTRVFTQKTGISCETVISSSGKLTAQIREGAPYDIFISADMKYPEYLFEKGLTTGQPGIYAYGKLVLWSVSDDIEPSIGLLKEDLIHHIAMANPMTAPYGESALEVLKYYDIYKNIHGKLVYGESISQTNQFIISGAAEIGFTAKSVVLSQEMKNKGKWMDIDPGIYKPIAQGMVILKNRTGHRQEAEKFHDFLLSDGSRDILIAYGYLIPEI